MLKKQMNLLGEDLLKKDTEGATDRLAAMRETLR